MEARCDRLMMDAEARSDLLTSFLPKIIVSTPRVTAHSPIKRLRNLIECRLQFTHRNEEAPRKFVRFLGFAGHDRTTYG